MKKILQHWKSGWRGGLCCLMMINMLIIVPQARANSSSADDLEQKVQELEVMLKAVKRELQEVRSEAAKAEEAKETAVHAKDQAELAKAKAEIVADRIDRKRMLFFRGGYGHSFEHRNGVTLQSSVAPIGAQDQANDDAWYIGAGIDFGLTKDAWGLLPNTDVMAELMFEYKRWGVAQGNALANMPTQLAGGSLNPRNVTVSQFTLTASPKIKFMEGSRFRPWIIPAGLAIHVISPPSESITVLTPGVMFAVGADYRVWKDFFVGVDSRYHVTGGKHDGVNVDGLTAGGYLGIGF